MTPETRKVAEAFNLRAAVYSRSGWHKRCAERLVELCRLRAGDRVLDAATGTGLAAIAAAAVIGEQGRVLGVDVSSGMLREARTAVEASGLMNIELLEADAVRLPDHFSGAFDVITCAAGLLYMPVPGALREWHRLLAPGGLIAFSTMRTGSPPAGRMFRDCAGVFGLSLRDPCEPLGTASACRTVLADAGFEVEQMVSEALDFTAQDFAMAWESNFKAVGLGDVQALTAEDQAALKTAYLDALARATRDNPGELARADLLYVFARRAG